MKLRHVRAIAVFGIAVVALTGARGSGGGGCDNHSSSGSSSSSNSSSGSTSGSGSHDDNGGSSSSTGGSVPGGSSSADKAARDVTIDQCKYDPATKNLTARITIKNDSSFDYDYDVTMRFTGASAVSATAFKSDIAVAAGASQSAELTTPYTGSGDGSEYTKCEVRRASRS